MEIREHHYRVQNLMLFQLKILSKKLMEPIFIQPKKTYFEVHFKWPALGQMRRLKEVTGPERVLTSFQTPLRRDAFFPPPPQTDPGPETPTIFFSQFFESFRIYGELKFGVLTQNFVLFPFEFPE